MYGWTNVDRSRASTDTRKPGARVSVREKLDAAKRKEEERRMNCKPSLREKLKKLVKGK